MALKRPKAPEPAQADVKLVDELVSKSLSINSQMRQGQDTQAFLGRMRQEAIQAEKEDRPIPADGAGRPPAQANKSKANRRMQTIRLLIEQKHEDVDEGLAEFEQRTKALELERKEFLRQAIDDIADVVSVVLGSGATEQECRQAISPYRDLLKKLDISDLQLIKEAARRR